MLIKRTKSYDEAMRIAHHYIKRKRLVGVSKSRNDKYWEVKVLARRS